VDGRERTGGGVGATAPLPGGRHWQAPEMVPASVPVMEREHAERAAELRVLRRMLPLPPDRPSRFADLGAGPGTVAAAVLKAFPRSEAVCVDFAPGRIGVGERYLAPFAGRFAYVEQDLAALRWEGALAGPFDAVVSAYAIHHVPDARKRALYREIFEHLRPGGAFLHLEVVRAPNLALEGLYWAKEGGPGASAWARRERLAAAVPEPLPPRPPERAVPTLDEQLAWLGEAGFVSVDCFWRTLPLALFGGFRPLPAP
jgi:tRNA (cmo5U34)-methyltransferase